MLPADQINDLVEVERLDFLRGKSGPHYGFSVYMAGNLAVLNFGADNRTGSLRLRVNLRPHDQAAALIGWTLNCS